MANETLPQGVEHTGKGWFKLPDGERVRGRDAVFEAMNVSGNGTPAQARNAEPDYRLERIQFARSAGWQYDGKRDVYEVAGYVRTPSFDHYWEYYDRHPVAGRIVELPPKTSWRYPPEITEEDRDDGTDFTNAVEELNEAVHLWQRLEKVDRLSRIGRYGVLMLGVADNQPLREPLQKRDDAQLAYLAQYSEKYARITEWDTDENSPRFGLPVMYTVDVSRGSDSFRTSTGQAVGRDGNIEVHWTRIIHVAEDTLQDDVYGRPALKRVLNTVFNDEKVDAASAEAFWQLADQILALGIDKDTKLTPTDETALGKAMEEIIHDLRRQIILQGGSLDWVGGDSPDPTGIAAVLAQKMAVGGGIPQRILFGSERGELASSQDERNWLGTVSERQDQHVTPNIVRPTLNRLIDFGILPRPATRAFDVEWPDLYKATDQEVAEQNKAAAETAKALTPVGGDPMDVVEIEDGMVMLRNSDDIRRDREREARRQQRMGGFDPGPPEAGGEGAGGDGGDQGADPAMNPNDEAGA